MDTGEDVPWQSEESKNKFFNDFREILTSKNVVDLTVDDSLFLSSAKPKELLLIKESKQIFNDFHKLENNLKVIIKDLIFSMSNGMQFFMSEPEVEQLINIKSTSDLNKYCFYVAGVVGEALSRLIAQLNNEEVSGGKLNQAYHFGLFLQKINILKDHLKDESEGRSFVASREELRRSIARHADKAFEYICSIESKNKDYKVFCAWSFYLGIASLPYIDKTFSEKKETKISRIKTMALLKKVEFLILKNNKLEDLFLKFKVNNDLFDLKDTTHESSVELDQSWMNCYQGLLEKSDMLRIVDCSN